MHGGRFFLAALTLVASAHAAAAQGVAWAGVSLHDGTLFTPTGKPLVASAPGRVVDFTVSPNRRFVVIVRRVQAASGDAEPRISTSIYDRKTRRQIQVGGAVGIPCCELGRDADEPSHVFGVFRAVHGAYWSHSQQVLVRFAGQTHILSMNGTLRGDV